MPSSFTSNKSIEQPATGSYNDSWSIPVNLDWEIVDTSLGGVTSINVTGVAAGSYALTVTQYRPINIVFFGAISANLVYVLPAGVGGLWTIVNNTTGGFGVTFAVSGGGSVAITQNQRSLIVCDGNLMGFADTAVAVASAAAAQANAEAFASAADTTVLATAEAFSANGSNISSGTVAAARIPLIGLLRGVTIAADPGTTPSGVSGDLFFYY